MCNICTLRVDQLWHSKLEDRLYAKSICMENCYVRRFYDDNIALYGKQYFYYIWELPVYAVMGVVAGLLGALFVKCYIFCAGLRAKYVPASSRRRRIAEVPPPLPPLPPHSPICISCVSRDRIVTLLSSLT